MPKRRRSLGANEGAEKANECANSVRLEAGGTGGGGNIKRRRDASHGHGHQKGSGNAQHRHQPGGKMLGGAAGGYRGNEGFKTDRSAGYDEGKGRQPKKVSSYTFVFVES